MEWGGDIVWSHVTSCFKGVAIAFKRGLIKYQINDFNVDTDGRFLLLEVTIKNRKFCFASIFGPNNDNPSFFF